MSGSLCVSLANELERRFSIQSVWGPVLVDLIHLACPPVPASNTSLVICSLGDHSDLTEVLTKQEQNTDLFCVKEFKRTFA